MNISSVAVSSNCLKSYFNSIQHKVHTVHQKICGLCNTDTKIYALLILGRMLQAAALVGTAVSIGFTFFSAQVALVGIITALAVGLLGTHTAGSPEELNDLLQMTRPFVVGQPIGLRNDQNNCWINSSLQLLAHMPTCHSRLRQIPQFAQFLDSYAASRASFEKVSRSIDSQAIRGYLSAQLGSNQVDPGPVQHDAAQVFEFLFEGQNALYQFEQQINGVASSNQVEPMIRVGLGQGTRPNFQELFNAQFDYRDDRGQRIQQFFPRSPNDLLIQAERFIQRNHPTTRTFLGLEKINDPLDVPERIELANRFVRTNESSNYVCDAFLVHYGSSANSGHYTAFVKTGNTWWCADDCRIFEISATHALDRMKYGYIFHYART